MWHAKLSMRYFWTGKCCELTIMRAEPGAQAGPLTNYCLSGAYQPRVAHPYHRLAANGGASFWYNSASRSTMWDDLAGA